MLALPVGALSGQRPRAARGRQRRRRHRAQRRRLRRRADRQRRSRALPGQVRRWTHLPLLPAGAARPGAGPARPRPRAAAGARRQASSSSTSSRRSGSPTTPWWAPRRCCAGVIPHAACSRPGAFIEALAESPIADRGRPLDHQDRLRAGRRLASDGSSARPHRRQPVPAPGSRRAPGRGGRRRAAAIRAARRGARARDHASTSRSTTRTPPGRCSSCTSEACELAFDDFGTGYASLNYLTALPGLPHQDRPQLHRQDHRRRRGCRHRALADRDGAQSRSSR